MKSRLSKFIFLGGIPVVLFSLMMGLSSCTETKTNKPAPTVAVNPTTTSGLAGAVVTASVQIDSPEGGNLLSILVNGQANSTLPDVTLDGSASQTVNVNFTIPNNAANGNTFLITFQATDKKSQASQLATLLVTVSAIPNKPIIDVPAGNITTNTTWTRGNIYRLNGFVRVGTDAIPSGGTSPISSNSTTLTIESGTVIYGKTGTPGGTLIIHRGSRLVANGTASQPIIFTSDKVPGQKKSGDWGGVVLCGNSTINNVGALGAGIAELEGGYGGYYGGGASASATDNSGSLSYVRIEYAGYPINPNQELNGLTLGGVGSGTSLSFIQVTYANDDSFEWFGGTVNATNIIAYKGIDDDFDTDNGYSGRVQFGLGIRDAIISDQSGSNGFESDNDGTGSNNTPVTSAVFSNMTIIGPKASAGTTIGTQFQNGAHLRRNTQQDIINSFITAYPTGFFIDGTNGGAITNATNGTLVLNNNVLAGVGSWGGNGFGTATTADENNVPGLPNSPNSNFGAPPRGRIVSAGAIASGSNPFQNGVFTVTEQQINSQNALPWFRTNNTVLANASTLNINSNIFEPLNGTPTLLPGAGSPLLTGAVFTNFPTGANINAGFQAVDYEGAFGTTDWTIGWVNWNPALTDYSK
jgi:hypothetical protein